MILIALLYCLSQAGLTEETTLRVEGPVGGDVSFQCSHRLARRYNKYFCKHPCESGGDTLATVAPGRRAEAGRILLVDSGGGAFTVTFRALRLSDSHRYYCAVERPAAVDTYTTVLLTVTDVPPAVLLDQTTPPGPEVSWTWTGSARLTSGPDRTVLANLSADVPVAPGRSSTAERILYAAVGAAAAVAVWVVATCMRRKCLSEPQAAVCCASDAHEDQVDYEYDDIDVVRRAVLNLSKSSNQRPAGGRPAGGRPAGGRPSAASAAASHHIDENPSPLRSQTSSRPAAKNTLPLRSAGKHGPAGRSSSTHRGGSRAAGPSSSWNESEDAKQESLWFGLDLSAGARSTPGPVTRTSDQDQ